MFDGIVLGQEMPAHYDIFLLHDLARTVYDGLGKGIIVHQQGPKKPAVIVADSSDAFVGLLMPMNNVPKCQFPAWVPVRRKRERASETL